MRVHHLNCGTFCPLGRRLINGDGGLFELGRLVCHCQLIEGASGLILVDTGIGLRDIVQPYTALPGRVWQMLNQAQLDPRETALRQVEELGYDAADVTDIVLTHLDFDHAGGLFDFPQARVHVLNVEYDEAMRRSIPRSRMRYAPAQYSHQPRWVVHERDGERWFGFDSVRPLPGTNDEILLIPLFGHSKGHCGVAIRTDSGWLLNAGDAFFYHGEVYGSRRSCPVGLRLYQNIFQYSHVQRMKNQRRLRELVHEAHELVTVICSHDPKMFDAFSAKTPPLHSAESAAQPARFRGVAGAEVRR